MSALSERRRRPPAVNPFTGRWVMEPKAQNVWGIPHALWFSLMGIGGALFINLVVLDLDLGRFFGLSVAKLVSLIVIGIGGLVLIGDLGRPLRLLRVLANPRTSWISVGAIADFVFVIVGGLWMIADLEVDGARPLGGLPWAGDSALGLVFQAVAGVAAFVVIVYPGLVLAFSPSIPFWNTTLIPLQFLAFAFGSAFAIAIAAAIAVPDTGLTAETWVPFLAAAVVASALLVAAHVLDARYSHATARVSLRRLVRGDLRPSFLGGLVVVGLLAPGLLLAVGASDGGELGRWALALAAVTAIAGNWFSKYAVIRAGTYAPYP